MGSLAYWLLFSTRRFSSSPLPFPGQNLLGPQFIWCSHSPVIGGGCLLLARGSWLRIERTNLGWRTRWLLDAHYPSRQLGTLRFWQPHRITSNSYFLREGKPASAPRDGWKECRKEYNQTRTKFVKWSYDIHWGGGTWTVFQGTWIVFMKKNLFFWFCFFFFIWAGLKVVKSETFSQTPEFKSFLHYFLLCDPGQVPRPL